MNARQKAKKYKRMYEMVLSKIRAKFEIDQHKIDTFRLEKYYPVELILNNSTSHSRAVVVNDMIYGLACNLEDKFDKYVNYFTEYCPNLDKYRFVGEIKIVEREVQE